jgi:benzoyl-CoA reductase subunit BamC
MCEETPALEKPKCVEWCLAEALIYVEREEEVDEDEQPKLGDIEISLGSMIDKYGLQQVLDTVARMAKP